MALRFVCLIAAVIYGLLLVLPIPLKAQDCYPTPAIVRVEAITAVNIQLEWEINEPDLICNTSLAGFNILYFTPSGHGTIVTDVNQRSHVVPASPPCTTHVFHIEAKYDDAITKRSKAKNVTLEEVPSVENLELESLSYDQILVTWWHVPPTCAISHYGVRYKLKDLDQCQVYNGKDVFEETNNASIVLGGLEAYSTYEIEVAPISDMTSPPLRTTWENGVTKTIVTGESVPNSTPDSVSADNTTRRQLTFTWDPPNCGDRNGVIIGYDYTLWKTSWNKTETILAKDFTTETTEIFSALEDYEDYRLDLRANTTSGAGPAAMISVRTAEGVPDAPSKFDTEVHLNSISMTWENLTHVPGVILAYIISHKKTDNNEVITYTRVFSNRTQFTLDGLSGRTRYTLQISAATGGGIGEWSEEKNVTTGIPVYSVVLLSILLVIVLLIVIVMTIGLIQHRIREHVVSNKFILEQPDGQSTTYSDRSLQLRNPYYTGIPGEVAWNKFKLGAEIGDGRYGKTFMTSLSSGDTEERRRAVCKKLTYKTGVDKDEVCREFSRLWQLAEHAHVIRVVGFCQRKGTLYLLKEYANQGSLHAYVHRDRPYGIPEMFKLRVSVAVAHGMQHLASHSIIHGDLCLLNIFLTDTGQEWVPKITDYGLMECRESFRSASNRVSSSSSVAAQHSLPEEPESWPVHQCPPEKLQNNIMSTKGDIWAFGVLVWEFFTESTAPECLRTGRVKERPNAIDQRLFNIMKHCWLADPKRRPQFFDLADALTAFIIPDDVENPYDELNPRAMNKSRNSLNSSSISQPRVSISSADVPDRRKSSSASRRGTAGNVYYSSVPVDDSVVLISAQQQQQEHLTDVDYAQREGVHEVEEFKSHYSSRMASIIPMMGSAGIQTIVEEPEPEVTEGQEADDNTETRI